MVYYIMHGYIGAILGSRKIKWKLQEWGYLGFRVFNGNIGVLGSTYPVVALPSSLLCR